MRMQLEIGQTLHGFSVRSFEEVPEIDGRAWVLDHLASKAQLLYLQNDDSNKAFSIAFKTPPENDTGVFHILEHSVLCGSRKFPVKEPFVNLLKSSMQTFLNAMTYPDKTVYPVASTNEQDLLNLMDVYLDAVLHPAIYEKKTIFEQEGWHVELSGGEDGADGERGLFYNGVVYNEMKGALSDPESVLYDALSAALFPDTAYRFESGGTPEAIPELTYEQFLETHRRHYRLDNSKLCLYGNLDIERFLAFLDEEYLAPGAEEGPKTSAGPAALELQAPVRPPHAQRVMDTAPDNSCCALGYVVGTASDRVRVMAADILIDAVLGSNEAPVKRALLDAGLANDVQAYLADALLQPFAVVQLRGLREGAAERLREVFERSVRALACGGLDRSLVTAAISHAEFVMREGNYGMADGVALALTSLVGWLYDDDAACDYLHYESAFSELREKVEEGYFENLLRELFLENPHMASAEVVPAEAAADAGAKAPGAAEMSPADALLARMEAALDREAARAIQAEVAKLRRAQEEPDSPEALATLPCLSASDIDPAPAEAAYRVDEGAPVRCIHHDVPTRGILYAYRYFDLKRVAFEELPYVTVLACVLGKLGTAKRSAAEIDTLAQSALGNLAFFAEVHEDAVAAEKISPLLVSSTSALAENAEWAAKLPREILLETDFSDHGKIRDVLVQKRVAMEQGFANAGHSAAMAHAASYYLPAAVVREQLGGVGFYLFLKELTDDFDARADELEAHLRELSARLFADDACTVSLTGPDGAREAFWAHGGVLGKTSDQAAAERRLVVPEPRAPKRGEAYIVPTDVVYAALGYDRRRLGLEYSGSWLVASRALSFDYLWNEVRVKGGAYGAGFQTTRPGNLRFYSYRDPHLDETIERFEGAGAWLSAFDPSETEMDGYVVSTVASIDAPVKPRELARRQDGQVFSGLAPDARRKTREEAARCTAADLRGLGQAVGAAADAHLLCVFGNRAIIEGAKESLETIDLLGR